MTTKEEEEKAISDQRRTLLLVTLATAMDALASAGDYDLSARVQVRMEEIRCEPVKG